jgi:iron complex outermembrane receptor protein
MVMKDGVPLTDPDSFTRFDFIDMQDVSSIEVQKGPGSINAANTTGGVIQLITKSVFEDGEDRIKIGLGDDGQYNTNLKIRGALSQKDFLSFTFSKRAIDNDWRDHNDFDSTQATLKHGHIFEDEATLETEVSYTESNMNIPASMTSEEEFQKFKDTGEQHDTDSPWQHSARDSKIFAINTKYEKEIGDFLLKPRFYFNTWEHFHPVTGMINDSDDNSVYGTDLELNYAHKAFGKEATLVAGVTYKYDKTNDAKKYQYLDPITQTVTIPYPPFTSYDKIIQTTSNEKGDLAQTEDSRTILYGAYLMETFSPNDEITIDVSTRIDKLSFDIDGFKTSEYDYSTGSYMDITGEDSIINIDEDYTLFSAKLGAIYRLTNSTNAYASIATANQAPTGSEIDAALEQDITLDKSTNVNYEIGLKTRTENLSLDLAIYQNNVDDEIVQTVSEDRIVYDNAGKTKKKGIELNTVYRVSNTLDIGGSYAYSNFKFDEYSENVRGSLVSRNGNYLPYIPKNQYSLFAAYRMENGFKARVTTKGWGSYYMDNANTQKYEGYDFVTDLMVGYEHQAHNIQLNVRNLTDKYYAMEASLDAYGNLTYKAAAPQSFMVTYSYEF